MGSGEVAMSLADVLKGACSRIDNLNITCEVLLAPVCAKIVETRVEY